MVLICISLITNGIEWLFKFIGHAYIFVCKVSVQLLYSLSVLLLHFMNSLCTPHQDLANFFFKGPESEYFSIINLMIAATIIKPGLV